jgi:CRISPR-associated protein Csd1
VGLERPLSLLQIMSSLAVKNEMKKLPLNLTGDLYLAILFHQPIPYTALQLAVTRNRVLADVSPARAALLQAWKSRKHHNSERRFFVTLDPECPSKGYQLGRLLAVCGSVQYRKSRNLNRTMIDRYFPAMSTRPALVLGALLRLTKQIQAQLPRQNGSPYLDSIITEIMSRISPDPPATLDLKEQANFALGFYHQRQQAKAAPEESTAEPAAEISLEEKEGH